jgi:hypothetical protein
MNPASRTSTVTGVLFAGNCVGKPSLRAKSKKPFMIEALKMWFTCRNSNN